MEKTCPVGHPTRFARNGTARFSSAGAEWPKSRISMHGGMPSLNEKFELAEAIRYARV
jgi:hypothetical protein